MTRHLSLAASLARRYDGLGEPLEDLVQVANVGLINAARRFDRSRGTEFAAYAVPMITGELKRHFRDHVWSLHVPRGPKERALAVTRAIRQELERSGAEPSPRQLAQQLRLREQDIVEALDARSAFRANSLDAPARPDTDSGESIIQTIGAVDEGYDLAERRWDRATAMRGLTRLERQILTLRYGEHRTQSDIADLLHVSQAQVSRVLRRTFGKLGLGSDRDVGSSRIAA